MASSCTIFVPRILVGLGSLSHLHRTLETQPSLQGVMVLIASKMSAVLPREIMSTAVVGKSEHLFWWRISSLVFRARATVSMALQTVYVYGSLQWCG